MIVEQDIKLLKSERLTDYFNGGGRMTGAAVIDGELNNLFPDISELDRVYGRVSLRKGFVGVFTDTVDTLYGVHAAITDPPDDERVHVNLFSTGSWSDERTAAKSRVESFVISGPDSNLVLYGDHLAGQMILRLFCEPGVSSPDVGEVFRLSVERTGFAAVDQYVRVIKVRSRESQTFTEISGATVLTFKKDVLLVELGSALRVDFPGGFPSKLTMGNSPTKFRTTQVADAARYYGVRPLAAPVTQGDWGCDVGTPYSPLVPSTQRETPLVDVLAGMGKLTYAVCGPAGSLTWSGSTGSSTGPSFAAARYLGQGCAPASVTVTIGAVVLSDTGSGALAPPPGDLSGYAGTVDYATGLVTVTRTSSWSAGVSIVATPAAGVADMSTTREIAITLSNRGYNYAPTLSPVPAPGTLTVDFRALGKWVRLTDNGKGQLTGRPGEGTGTIDYASGSVIATLGALPDVGSSVLFSWATPVHFVARAGDTSIAAGALEVTVEHPAIKPGSVTLKWLTGGVEKTATDNGVGGLAGDATGSVHYSSGRMLARPTAVPDGNSTVQVTYTSTGRTALTAGPVIPTGRTYRFTVGSSVAPLKPASVEIRLTAYSRYTRNGVSHSYAQHPLVWTDDGAGNLTGKGLQGGTINYATGAVVATLALTVEERRWEILYYIGGDFRTPVYGWRTATPVIDADSFVFDWSCVAAAASEAPYVETGGHDGVTLDLTPLVNDAVVPGSVRLTFAGQVFVDRDGAMVRSVSATTNAGTVAGTIDYATGTVKLTNYVGGANLVTVQALATATGAWVADRVFFRTPGNPLKPGSLTVRATRVGGDAQITATATTGGVLAADSLAGEVDVNTGVVEVRFGARVLATTLSDAEKAEGWYHASQIDGDGKIWRPDWVIPSTIRFNAVVFSSVPLSAEVLGIDPVRLPQDGRVPIYRAGDVVLVHHTATTTVASPTAGAVVSLRPRIAMAKVHDALGAAVPGNRYTLDLTAGTLTWATPLVLAGFSPPYVITHRIEDLLLCADVQITGELTFVSPISHDYPAGTAYASSCLIVGDMQARVDYLHDLVTFTAWSNVATGAEAPANYNAVLYPIEVTNRGAVEERWRITFASSATVNVIGETYGQIATGISILADVAPINPQTGVPYFRLKAAGFGSGWATGNTIRFNTVAANYPLWFIRTTLQGEVTAPNDHFRIQIRGDAD